MDGKVWKTAYPMEQAVAFSASIVIGDELFVVGGGLSTGSGTGRSYFLHPNKPPRYYLAC